MRSISHDLSPVAEPASDSGLYRHYADLCGCRQCCPVRSSKQYGDAMVQRLSLELASKIVKSESLIDASGQVNRQTLKGLFNHLMTLNPSVELYLVSPSGEILADAAPPGHIQRQKISVQPIQDFLNSDALPVYGNDPRSSQQKVFSAAPVLYNGELHGYLYIILQGEDLNMLANTARQKRSGIPWPGR